MGKYCIQVDEDRLEIFSSAQKSKAGILSVLTPDEKDEFDILDTMGKILFVLLRRKKVLSYKALARLVGMSSKTVERYLKSAPLKDIVMVEEEILRDPWNKRFRGKRISLRDWELASAFYDDILNKYKDIYSDFE
jgi:hypothetical protein